MRNTEVAAEDEMQLADRVRSSPWLTEQYVRILAPSSFIMALLILWELIARFDGRSNAYFPTLEFVVRQTFEFQSTVVTGIQVTATEAILGFIVAMIVGITAGILFAEFGWLRQSSLPMVVFGYSLPHAVMAPIFLLWFGNSLFAVALFVSWFGFFTIFVNTLTGFSQIKPELYELGEVLGASRWQMIRKIKFWAALPHITSATKIAVQQSIVGAIIAEFIATGAGLGYTLQYAIKLGNTGLLFGSLFVLLIFSIVFFKTIEFLLDYITPSPAEV